MAQAGAQHLLLSIQRILQKLIAQLLPLQSMHNVTKEDLASGATYFNLMRRNLENLRRGLGAP